MPLLHLVALLLGVILQVLLPGSHGIGERGLAGVGIAGVVAELAASVDLERQELVAGGHIGGFFALLPRLLLYGFVELTKLSPLSFTLL